MNHNFPKISLTIDHAEKEQIDREIRSIEGILAKGFWRLRFPKLIEKDYREYSAGQRLIYSRLAVWIAFSMVLVLGLLDVLFLKTMLTALLLIRYAVVAPIMAYLAWFSLRSTFIHWQQSILLLLFCLTATVVIVPIMIAPLNVASLYFSGLLLVIIFGFCLARIYFSYAIVGAVFIGAAYNVAILIVNTEAVEFELAHNFFYWSACGLGLLCNYSLEHSSRTEYLQAYLLELHQNDLEKANEKLQELAIVDGLTGIPNRRHFDEVFAHEWRRAQRTGQQLSLLMLDIDFFKKYNDTYGHQAGDECLSKVANCLRLCLKRPGDLVARYGGEEFVVLLPELDKDGAAALGRLMCEQVEALGLIHEASTVSSVVTISVGAACVYPSAIYTPEQLLSNADDALYEAKGTGRNKVVVSSS